ncbi:hypothetical protein HDU78_010573 [Chytriomyces hyalinus]|nr:hypothetical protein HDU78_010573 [Chytriomyces hyalinus]
MPMNNNERQAMDLVMGEIKSTNPPPVCKNCRKTSWTTNVMHGKKGSIKTYVYVQCSRVNCHTNIRVDDFLKAYLPAMNMETRKTILRLLGGGPSSHEQPSVMDFLKSPLSQKPVSTVAEPIDYPKYSLQALAQQVSIAAAASAAAGRAAQIGGATLRTTRIMPPVFSTPGSPTTSRPTTPVKRDLSQTFMTVITPTLPAPSFEDINIKSTNRSSGSGSGSSSSSSKRKRVFILEHDQEDDQELDVEIVTSKQVREILMSHQRTVTEVIAAVDNRNNWMKDMESVLTTQALEILELHKLNTELEQAIFNLSTANGLSSSATSHASVVSAQSNHSPSQPEIEESDHKPQIEDSNQEEQHIEENYTQLQIIDSILDRAAVADGPSAPHPSARSYQYRPLSNIESNNGIALLYVVGIKRDTTYSRVRQQLGALGFPVQAIFNISKISNTTVEFMVDPGAAGFICQKFCDTGFKILEHFKMNKPGTSVSKLAWNAHRLAKIEQNSTYEQVQYYSYAAVQEILIENPSIDMYSPHVTLDP